MNNDDSKSWLDSGFGERLNQVIKMLGLTQSGFGSLFGVKQSTISGYINGSYIPPLSLLPFILEIEPNLSTDWLIKGEGTPFPESPGSDIHPPVPYGVSEYSEPFHSTTIDSIPVVPSQLVSLPSVNVLEEITNYPHQILNVLRSNIIADICLKVKDMAMHPEIQQGDYVFLKRIESTTHIVNGSIYAVDTISNGLIVRMLYEEDDHYRAHSRTDRYTDFIIDKCDVYNIYAIVMVWRTI